VTHTWGAPGGGLLDHFDHPRNAGGFEDPDAVGWGRNPACGDLTELHLRVRGGVVAEARFRTFGCGAAIAAASAATEMIRGMSLQEAGRVSASELEAALGGLSPAQRHGALVAEDAVRAAVADHASRRGRARTGAAEPPGPG
jgi:nitrogen fixation NifU-like protein